MNFFARYAAYPALMLTVIQPAVSQSLDSLGDLPGSTFTTAAGISADGTVVVGRSVGTNGPEAYRWTQGGGMVGLGDLAGGAFNSEARGVSADGAVTVGVSVSANGDEAFRWTQGGGMVGLGDLAGGSFNSGAIAVNADGTVVVGYATSISGGEAFRWTQGGGMVGLGDLAGGIFSSVANAVNADGSVVVGTSVTANGTEAFRWTQGGGMVGLGDLAGGIFASSAAAVNADGSVVVGSGASANGREAFRWTQGSGMIGLGDLAGGNFGSSATAVNADGSVVVGFGASAAGNEAFRWTQATGMQSLTDILTAANVNLTDWTLQNATGVSADGSVIVGNGSQGGNDVAFIFNMNGTTPGVTTPDELARSVASAVTPGQQGQEAIASGLQQSMFVARQANVATPLPRQVASADGAAGWSSPQPSRWSAYAVGSLGNGQDNNSGNWGLNGATGLFVELSPGLHVGAGVIGTHGNTELYLDGESRLGAVGGSVIVSYEAPSGLRLNGSALAAALEVDTDRHYMNGAGVDSSRGETSGIGYGAAVRGGWEFPVAANTAITPYAELQWSMSQLDGYAEQGGAFPATFESQTSRLLTSHLGAELSRQFTPALEVQARAAWAHRLSGQGGQLTATVIGLTQTLSGVRGDDDWAEGAVAAVWRMDEATTFSAQLGGRSGDTTAPAVDMTLGITVRF